MDSEKLGMNRVSMTYPSNGIEDPALKEVYIVNFILGRSSPWLIHGTCTVEGLNESDAMAAAEFYLQQYLLT